MSVAIEPRVVSATELRVHLGEILDSVEHSQTAVIVERGGHEMAAVIPIADYRQRRRQPLSAEWWQRQNEIAAEIEQNLAGRPRASAKELIDADRD